MAAGVQRHSGTEGSDVWVQSTVGLGTEGPHARGSWSMDREYALGRRADSARVQGWRGRLGTHMCFSFDAHRSQRGHKDRMARSGEEDSGDGGGSDQATCTG
ncbi:hypothetical protein E2562_000543 [Oryza meyeriana var. granulata]|uniref:Uncharacterized protein n=1 Tax=Oryza meyeriana var. granulata TaxID=110450 RepID=A0A6G1DTV5_9ORYZ|nr:hypothetical protein E2562_000543 [Oryza meyeriana var. granulata]